MTKFVLTAALRLQAPKNTASVVNTIRNQLQGITATVNIAVSPQGQKQLQAAQRTLKDTTKSAIEAESSIKRFGESAALAAKRFLAFSIAGGAIIKFASSLRQGISEAIIFERQLNKIAQATGSSNKAIASIGIEISRLSTYFGVSSSELSQASLVLAQAGLSASETQQSLEALAKSDLAPTFDSIINTTEGAIAIFRQFKVEAKDLESVLGSINSVAAKFAVESADIIAAVRRTGGAFEAAGGSLNELIALFTSVRSTTRESAESIATGFRTIFTRMQRMSTQNFLKTVGVDLQNLEGQFVGPYEAVRRLSTALSQIQGTDPRFSQIIEELGGFRQVSKVIPLIQQFDVAQKALNVAMSGSGSLSIDAARAQETLAVQIQKTKEQFAEMIRTITNSASFKGMVVLGLKLAEAFMKVATALTPLLPLLTTLTALSLGRAIGPFIQGFKQKGGLGFFASGGMVPGSGNRDTVPAMLTPGEFVIRKKAVEHIGVNNLARMNKGGIVRKYEEGGEIYQSITRSDDPSKVESGIGQRFGAIFLSPGESGSQKTPVIGNIEEGVITVNTDGTPGFSTPIKANLISRSFSKEFSKSFVETIDSALVSVSNKLTKQLSNEISSSSSEINKASSITNYESMIGNLWETSLRSVGAGFEGNQTGFDFPSGVGPKLSSVFGIPGDIPTDAKKTWNKEARASLRDKIFNWYKDRNDLYRSTFKPIGRPTSTKEQNVEKLSARLGSSLGILPEGSEITTGVLRKIKDSKGNPLFSDTTIGQPKLVVQTLKQLGIDVEIQKQGYTTRFFKSKPLEANTGGLIPGVGSRDTVPAMLTPGEFVIRKKAVEHIGVENLAKMNKGGAVRKYTGGGLAEDAPIRSYPDVEYKKIDNVRRDMIPDPSHTTEFSHLDSIRIGLKNQPEIFKKLTQKHKSALKDKTLTRAVILTNFGLDLPRAWNQTWRDNAIFNENKTGVTSETFSKYIKDENIFKSLLRQRGTGRYGSFSKNFLTKDFNAKSILSENEQIIKNSLSDVVKRYSTFYTTDPQVSNTVGSGLQQILSGISSKLLSAFEEKRNVRYKEAKITRSITKSSIGKGLYGDVQQLASGGTAKSFDDMIPTSKRGENTTIQDLLYDQRIVQELNKRLNINNLKFLGSGAYGVAFQDLSSQEVIRLENREVKRAQLAEMLQAIDSELISVSGKPFTIERLPYKPDLGSDFSIPYTEYENRVAKLQTQVADVGYSAEDLHMGNVALSGDGLQVIDPGSIIPSHKYQKFKDKAPQYQKRIGTLSQKKSVDELRELRRKASQRNVGANKEMDDIIMGPGNVNKNPKLKKRYEKLMKVNSVSRLHENILISAIRQKMGMQQFAQGGLVSPVKRVVGYLDGDVLADPTNADIVNEEINRLGIKGGVQGYHNYLIQLANQKRKSGNLRRFKAIHGVPGSGKSSLMLGGASDNASLRQTSRIPILRPTDIDKVSEVLDAVAHGPKVIDQLGPEGSFSNIDRLAILSSSTKEEQEEIIRRRSLRDKHIQEGTSQTAFGRPPGTTRGAPLDTGAVEAVAMSELGKKRTAVLGISPDFKLRRKKEEEIPDLETKKLGLFYGALSPSTTGHARIMETAKEAGIDPKDLIVAVSKIGGTAKKGDEHSQRTVVFSQKFRKALAEKTFPRSVVVGAGTQDFLGSVPKVFETKPTSNRRKFVRAASGSIAFTGDDKDEAELLKYKSSGYDVKSLERDDISGTMARQAIMDNDVEKMRKLFTPEAFDLIQKNRDRIVARSSVLSEIFDRVDRRVGSKAGVIDQELSQFPKQITAKVKKEQPEIAEKVSELRKKRDAIKRLKEKMPTTMLYKLAELFPQKYDFLLEEFANGGQVFKPELTGRGIAEGNVGRHKQFLMQYKDFLSEKKSTGLLTNDELKELIGLQSRLSFIKQYRTERFSKRFGFAKGGNVDTVPALLTPGEFVINKRSASRLGRTTLERLNNVDKFNTGGAVGAIKMSDGGMMSGMSGIAGAGFAMSGIMALTQQFQGLNKTVDKIIGTLSSFGAQVASLVIVSKSLGSMFSDHQKKLADAQTSLQGLQQKKAGLKTPEYIQQGKIAGEAKLKEQDSIIRRDHANKEVKKLKSQYLSEKAAASTPYSKALAQTTKQKLQDQQQEAFIYDKEATKQEKIYKQAKQKIDPVIKESKSLDPQIASQQKLVDAQERNVKNINAATIGMSVLAAGANAAGSYLEQIARAQLESGKGGETAFRTAKTISGAGSGAGMGLAVGMALIPLFTKLSAALGPLAPIIVGLAGAAIMATKAFFDSGREIANMKAIKGFNKSLEQTGRVLDDLSNKKISFDAASIQVRRQAESTFNQLSDTNITPETKQDITSQTKSQLDKFNNYLNIAAKDVANFDEFINKAGDGVFNLVADMSGMSTAEFRQSIERQIESYQKAKKAQEELVKVKDDYADSLRNVINITKAFETASLSIQSFASTLDTLVSFSDGAASSLKLLDESVMIGSPDKFGDSKRFGEVLERDVRSNPFLNFTPPDSSETSGQLLAKDIADAQKAIKDLPNILFDLRNNIEAFGPDVAVDQLMQNFDGASDIVKRSIRQAAQNIVGKEGNEAELIDRFRNDMQGLLKELGPDALKPVLEAGQIISSKMVEETNRRSAINDQLMAVMMKEIDIRNRGLDIESKAEEMFARVENRPTDLTKLKSLDVEKQKNILGPDDEGLVNKPLAIGIALRQAENDLLATQNKLREVGTDIDGELNETQREQQVRVQRLNAALKHLEDVGARTATTMQKFERAQKAADFQGGLAEKFTFAESPVELRDLGRTLRATREAAATGSIDVVDPKLRGDVLAMLQDIGPAKLDVLGGMSGKETVELLTTNKLMSRGWSKEAAEAIAKRQSVQLADIHEELKEEVALSREANGIIRETNARSQANITTLNDESIRKFADAIKNVMTAAEVESIESSKSRDISEQKKITIAQENLGKMREQTGTSSNEDAMRVGQHAELVKQYFKDIENQEKFGSFAFLAREEIARTGSEGDIGIPGVRNATIVPDSTHAEARQKIETQRDKIFKDTDGDIRIIGAFDDLVRKNLQVDQESDNVRGSHLTQTIKEATLAAVAEAERLSMVSEPREELQRQGLQEFVDNLEAFGPNGELDFEAIQKKIKEFEQMYRQVLSAGTINEFDLQLKTLTENIRKHNEKLRGLGAVAPDVIFPPMFNKGGFVPGVGTRDTVPAILTPGEFVLSRQMVSDVGKNNLLTMARGGVVRNLEEEKAQRRQAYLNQKQQQKDAGRERFLEENDKRVDRQDRIHEKRERLDPLNRSRHVEQKQKERQEKEATRVKYVAEKRKEREERETQKRFEQYQASPKPQRTDLPLAPFSTEDYGRSAKKMASDAASFYLGIQPELPPATPPMDDVFPKPLPKPSLKRINPLTGEYLVISKEQLDAEEEEKRARDARLATWNDPFIPNQIRYEQEQTQRQTDKYWQDRKQWLEQNPGKTPFDYSRHSDQKQQDVQRQQRDAEKERKEIADIDEATIKEIKWQSEYQTGYFKPDDSRLADIERLYYAEELSTREYKNIVGDVALAKQMVGINQKLLQDLYAGSDDEVTKKYLEKLYPGVAPDVARKLVFKGANKGLGIASNRDEGVPDSVNFEKMQEVFGLNEAQVRAAIGAKLAYDKEDRDIPVVRQLVDFGNLVTGVLTPKSLEKYTTIPQPMVDRGSLIGRASDLFDIGKESANLAINTRTIPGLLAGLSPADQIKSGYASEAMFGLGDITEAAVTAPAIGGGSKIAGGTLKSTGNLLSGTFGKGGSFRKFLYEHSASVRRGVNEARSPSATSAPRTLPYDLGVPESYVTRATQPLSRTAQTVKTLTQTEDATRVALTNASARAKNFATTVTEKAAEYNQRFNVAPGQAITDRLVGRSLFNPNTPRTLFGRMDDLIVGTGIQSQRAARGAIPHATQSARHAGEAIKGVATRGVGALAGKVNEVYSGVTTRGGALLERGRRAISGTDDAFGNLEFPRFKARTAKFGAGTPPPVAGPKTLEEMLKGLTDEERRRYMLQHGLYQGPAGSKRVAPVLQHSAGPKTEATIIEENIQELTGRLLKNRRAEVSNGPPVRGAPSLTARIQQEAARHNLDPKYLPNEVVVKKTTKSMQDYANNADIIGDNTRGAAVYKPHGNLPENRIVVRQGVGEQTAFHEIGHIADRKRAMELGIKEFFVSDTPKVQSALNPLRNALRKHIDDNNLYANNPVFKEYVLEHRELLAELYGEIMSGRGNYFTSSLRKATGFQAGALVPGYGSGDKVPALLEPGEFVLNRNAVSAIGVGKLNHVNKKIGRFQKGGPVKMQDGGVVNSNGMVIDASQLERAVQNFGTIIDNFVNSVNSISGLSITLNARHTVEVIINGAQVMLGLESSIQNLVTSETNKAINNMLDKKFNLPPISNNS